MTATNDHTCRELVGEVIVRDGTARRRGINTIHLRTDIGHTTTAIEVLDNDIGIIFDIQQQALRTGHRTLVTTAIEVADATAFQVPCRTDLHLCLVVSAKDAGEIEGIAGEVTLESREFDLCLQVCKHISQN